MFGRTDLAIEKKDLENAVFKEEKRVGNNTVSVCEAGEKGAKEKYITVFLEPLITMLDEDGAVKAVKESLKELLGDKNSFLVVGLGNIEITADSIGPRTASGIFATRHIPEEIVEKLGVRSLKKVSVICPSVLGKTGIEAAELIEAAVKKIRPEAVIVLDALAAAEYKRIFRTIQLSSAGISPGSGVKNARAEISRKTLGIPVAAVGVPTVTDIENLCSKEQKKGAEGLIVTPKDCDLLCDKISGILAQAINEFLQPELDGELIKELV